MWQISKISLRSKKTKVIYVKETKSSVRKIYPDPKFHSEVVSKFINSIMYDGKDLQLKILYDALDKIKLKIMKTL